MSEGSVLGGCGGGGAPVHWGQRRERVGRGKLGADRAGQRGQKEESLVFESGLESRGRKKELLLVVVKEMGFGVC